MPVSAPSSTVATSLCTFQDQLFDLAAVAQALREQGDDSAADPRPAESFSPAQIGLGILSHFCGPELIERVLAERPVGTERCRKLPPQLTTGLLLLMGLTRRLSYRSLMLELRDAAPASARWSPPTATAFHQARQRLGCEVMERLYHLQAVPLAEQDLASSFWRGRRVVAIDGTTLPLESTPELEDAFGGQVDGDTRVGPPQLRAVSLVECGTRAQLGAEIDAYAKGEVEMAARLASSLTLDMLLLADRNFFESDLWRTYRERGADLLWRIKGNVANRILQHLADGSYLAEVRGHHKRPLTVRVIEYAIEGSEEIYRLATNLLDPQTAPAHELARLYTERWEIELSYREIKAVQLDGRGLRSRTEEGVRQEFWSVLAAYNLSRRLCYEAAMMLPERDPDQVSFSLALGRIVASVRKVASLQLRRLRAAAYCAARVLADARHRLKRRDRSCPRLVRHRRSKYASRGTCQGPASSRQKRCPPIYVCGAPDPSQTP